MDIQSAGASACVCLFFLTHFTRILPHRLTHTRTRTHARTHSPPSLCHPALSLTHSSLPASRSHSLPHLLTHSFPQPSHSRTEIISPQALASVTLALTRPGPPLSLSLLSSHIHKKKTGVASAITAAGVADPNKESIDPGMPHLCSLPSVSTARLPASSFFSFLPAQLWLLFPDVSLTPSLLGGGASEREAKREAVEDRKQQLIEVQLQQIQGTCVT